MEHGAAVLTRQVTATAAAAAAATTTSVTAPAPAAPARLSIPVVSKLLTAVVISPVPQVSVQSTIKLI
jgi:hypothetical protein